MDSRYVNEEKTNVLILIDTHMCNHKLTYHRKTRETALGKKNSLITISFTGRKI